MAGLNDIPAEFVALETDIANGAYAKGVEDLGTMLVTLGQFGQSIGFKATPEDEKTCKDIEGGIKRCIAACAKDKKKALAGAFDWKSLLAQILTTLLQWWISRPTPPAPAPTP